MFSAIRDLLTPLQGYPKGKWVVTETGFAVDAADYRIRAEPRKPRLVAKEELEAIARLIAAAPVLRDELAGVIDMLDCKLDDMSDKTLSVLAREVLERLPVAQAAAISGAVLLEESAE